LTEFRLETKRLVLRRFAEADAEPFSRYRSDPAVAQYQGWEAPYSLERAREYIDYLTRMDSIPPPPGQWVQIAVSLKMSDTLIGDCGFKRLVEDARQAEIGFTLARPFQGQGYGSEAVTCLIEYLFAELELHRIRANIDPLNRASARLLEKVGMRCEGRWLESLWFKGAWASEDWYAVLRREWIK
jgi:aminoglycoside 6'-N-acetyltransferase